MLNNLLFIILLLLGFPTGLFLAWFCKDEIKAWKKRMIAISVICLILAILLSFVNYPYKIPAVLSLFFMTITSLMIVWKSH